jgi:hypothetical protein
VYGYIECTVLFNIGDIGFHDYTPFFLQPFPTLSQLGLPDSLPAFLLLGSQKPAFFGPGRGLKGEADEKLHEN